MEFETATVTFQIGTLHKEEIILSLIDSLFLPVVLKYPWLQQHNPSFKWVIGELTSWGVVLSELHIYHPKRLSHSLFVSVTIPPNLPQEYYNFADVFCKKKSRGSIPLLSSF